MLASPCGPKQAESNASLPVRLARSEASQLAMPGLRLARIAGAMSGQLRGLSVCAGGAGLAVPRARRLRRGESPAPSTSRRVTRVDVGCASRCPKQLVVFRQLLRSIVVAGALGIAPRARVPRSLVSNGVRGFGSRSMVHPEAVAPTIGHRRSLILDASGAHEKHTGSSGHGMGGHAGKPGRVLSKVW